MSLKVWVCIVIVEDVGAHKACLGRGIGLGVESVIILVAYSRHMLITFIIQLKVTIDRARMLVLGTVGNLLLLDHRWRFVLCIHLSVAINLGVVKRLSIVELKVHLVLVLNAVVAVEGMLNNLLRMLSLIPFLLLEISWLELLLGVDVLGSHLL